MKHHLILLAFVAALPLAGMLAGGQSGAEAAERPVLRGNVTATNDIVTIGDFFENPGPNASRALFRAPDLGRTGTCPRLTCCAARPPRASPMPMPAACAKSPSTARPSPSAPTRCAR